MTIQTLNREIKLGGINGDIKLTIDTSLLPKKSYYFWNKKRKLILKLFEKGAVLTGSTALSLYKLNGVDIFNRKPNDWDFLMTKKDFLKFCKEINYYPSDLDNSQYHLDKSFASFSDGYGGHSYWFKCLIQIVIKDELTNFIEIDGKRFATLQSIIESKEKLSITSSNSIERSKHSRDLSELMINLLQ